MGEAYQKLRSFPEGGPAAEASGDREDLHLRLLRAAEVAMAVVERPGVPSAAMATTWGHLGARNLSRRT